MKKINFSIDIKAPKEKIWKVLWDDSTYREWTSPFMEGSYAESDWKEGSKIHFLTPSGEGMYSIIAKKTDNEFMSFKHIGTVKDGKEQPLDAESKKWSGATENYTLKEHNGTTTLIVELDTSGSEWEDMLKEAFPKALNKVKELAENKGQNR